MPVTGVALGDAGVLGAGALGGVTLGEADGAGGGEVFDRLGLGTADLDPELLVVPEEVLVRVATLLPVVAAAALFEPEFGIAAGVLEELEAVLLGVVSVGSLGAAGNEGAATLGEDGVLP